VVDCRTEIDFSIALPKNSILVIPFTLEDGEAIALLRGTFRVPLDSSGWHSDELG
jgi:hypothetical protein